MNGVYKVKSIDTDNGILIVTVNSPAASTQSQGGGTVTADLIWGDYKNSEISGNYFLNTNSLPGDGLIVVEGSGNTVKNNKVSGGTYGGFVLTSWREITLPIGIAVAKTTVFGNGPYVSGDSIMGTGIVHPFGGFSVSGDTTSDALRVIGNVKFNVAKLLRIYA